MGSLNVPSWLLADSICCGVECLLLTHSRHWEHHWPRGPKTSVRRDPATDRRLAAEASADMTACVIAAIGLNRWALSSSHLPGDRLHAPDSASPRPWTRRVAHPKRLVQFGRTCFRSTLSCATVVGDREEPSGESRFTPRPRSSSRRVLPQIPANIPSLVK